MPGLGELFGKGSIGEQLFVWGLLNQVVSALTLPGVNELGYLVMQAAQNVPIDPASGASLVARKLIAPEHAANDAAKVGISPGHFQSLVDLAMTGPDLGSAAEAFRRGIIGEGGEGVGDLGLAEALTLAGVRPEWHPIYAQLAVQIPSLAEVIVAYVKSQISEGEARDRWKKGGGEPDWFDTAMGATGNPPAPGQLAEMAHRGLIPWTGVGPDALTFEQGIREGLSKNKWTAMLQAVAIYLPPPRTITAMLKAGEMTHAEAAGYLVDYGLTPSLARSYLSVPIKAHTATEKMLAKSDLIALYEDKLMTKAQAMAGLEALKYPAADAALLLLLADTKVTTATLRQAVARIKALFQASKISTADAAQALTKLGAPATEIPGLIAQWHLAKGAVVKTLTVAEITGAFHYQLMTQDEAMADLQGIGYSALDAWMILSVHNHGALPNRPAG